MGNSRPPAVTRDVMPSLYTAFRKIPMDFTHASRSAVNRIIRSLRCAKRETRIVLFLHCAPDPTLMWATCDAHLRTFGLVEQRLFDLYNYSDPAPLPTNRYHAWLCHTAPNYLLQRAAPSVHRGVRR